MTSHNDNMSLATMFTWKSDNFEKNKDVAWDARLVVQ
jgi:hypothetical protein